MDNTVTGIALHPVPLQHEPPARRRREMADEAEREAEAEQRRLGPVAVGRVAGIEQQPLVAPGDRS